MSIAKNLYFFLVISLFASGFSRASDIGTEVRYLLRDIVTASLSQDQSERAHLLDEALLKHPAVFEAWIRGKTPKDLLSEAGLQLDDTLRAHIENSLSAYFLQKLNFLKSDFPKGSEMPFQWQLNHAETVQTALKPHEELLLSLARSVNIDTKRSMMKAISPAAKNELISKISQEIERVQLSDFQIVQELKDPRFLEDIKGVPKEAVKIFETVVETYFNHMTLETKQKIIIDLLSLPPSATKGQQISVVLQNSGPLMQKLFQLIGKRSTHPLVREASDQLLSNIKPFPFAEVKKRIETRTGKSIEDIFSEFNIEPLAAGTVGQVHTGKLKGSNKKVAIKILRPNIQSQAEYEFKLIRENLAPEYLPTFDELKAGILRELNLYEEAKAIARGKENYESPSEGIYVAGVAEGTEAYEDLLFLEFADGKPMNKQPTMTAQEKFQQSKRFSQFVKKWAYQVLFNGGFAHVDLHGGNIFYDISQSHPNGKQTLIDFGSTINLRPTTARSFIRLLSAIHLNNPGFILKAIQDDAFIPPEKETAVKRNIQLILEDNHIPKEQKAGFILNQIQQMGIPIAAETIHLLRGKLFLEEHISTLNSELDQLDPDKKLGRFTARSLFLKSGLRGLAKDFYRFVTGKSGRTFTPEMIARLAFEIPKYQLTKTATKVGGWLNRHCAFALMKLARPR